MPATDQRLTNHHIRSACHNKVVTWDTSGRLKVVRMDADGVSTHDLGQRPGINGKYEGESLTTSDDIKTVARALLAEMGARPKEVEAALPEAAKFISDMREKGLDDHTLVLDTGVTSLEAVLGLNADRTQGIDLRHSL